MRLFERLSYSNVVATLALFVELGGTVVLERGQERRKSEVLPHPQLVGPRLRQADVGVKRPRRW